MTSPTDKMYNLIQQDIHFEVLVQLTVVSHVTVKILSSPEHKLVGSYQNNKNLTILCLSDLAQAPFLLLKWHII